MNTPKIKLLALSILLVFAMGCGGDEATPSPNDETEENEEEEEEERSEVVNTTPFWRVSDRIFNDGPVGSFDDIAVKDPSIVFFEERYHLFFTGRNQSNWTLGYASAETLEGLNEAEHIYLSNLNGGGYAAAPQVFFNRYDRLWYLVYQTGPATFSTNDDISDPSGWEPAQSMGFGDGIDFWIISDTEDFYCFYSAQDGTRTIKRRKTTIEQFPFGWEDPEIVATNTFEAVHVYKNLGNNKYYMIVEDIARHQELWEAEELGAEWTKLEEQWAHEDDLVHPAEQWTEQVSHVELIRADVNELMEIESLNRCQMLFQGVLDGDYGEYFRIPYDLGVLRNY